jgi:hypothetical protein
MVAADPNVIPEQKPSLTPTGRPTLKKRTKSERNELYVSMLASQALATAKETFAVAVAINRVVLLVLRKQASAGLGLDRVEPLFCGTFTRELLDGADWSMLDLVRVLDEVPDALLKRRGQAGELQPLDLSEERELAEVVEAVQAGLAHEASD